MAFSTWGRSVAGNCGATLQAVCKNLLFYKGVKCGSATRCEANTRRCERPRERRPKLFYARNGRCDTESQGLKVVSGLEAENESKARFNTWESALSSEALQSVQAASHTGCMCTSGRFPSPPASLGPEEHRGSAWAGN